MFSICVAMLMMMFPSVWFTVQAELPGDQLCLLDGKLDELADQVIQLVDLSLEIFGNIRIRMVGGDLGELVRFIGQRGQLL
jgi:hypothetical protein